MYGLQYEDDLLLFLRLMKFLHTQVPKVVEQICKEYPTVDENDISMILEELLWNVLDDVEIDSDEFDETSILYCSHPDIDRLYGAGQKITHAQGVLPQVWGKKLHDIVEFFMIGATNSVLDFSQTISGDHVVLKLRLSPDCYEPLYFANSIVDMLLYCQRSVQRMEAEFTETKPKTRREEAA